MTPEKAFGKVLREIRQEHPLSNHRSYISLLKRAKEKLIIE
jgi:hypothetical protein